MEYLGQEAPDESDNDATVVLTADQKRLLYQRRTALLSGLLAPEQQAPDSPALAELVQHREQVQARQTRALHEFLHQEAAAERARTQVIRPPAVAPSRVPLPEPRSVAPPQPPQAVAPTPPQAPPPGAAKQTVLKRVWARLRPRRVPVLYQLTAVECGAACLA